MVLAGVLLKMGGYGLIRLNLEMLSDAHVYFAPILAILGVVNIVYGGLNSFGQSNMKRRLAYSSVAHMGFVLLGIASYMSSSLIICFNHFDLIRSRDYPLLSPMCYRDPSVFIMRVGCHKAVVFFHCGIEQQ